MRINTRLRLNTSIILGLLLLLAAALIWSALATRAVDANAVLAGKMQKSVSDRLMLRDDYLMRQSERARIQWETGTEALRGLLVQAWDQLPATDQPILDGIENDFADTVSLFHQIVEIRESPVPAGAEVSAEGEQRLISQLLLSAYSLNNGVQQLRDTTQAVAGSAHTLLEWLMFSIMVAVLITTLVNSSLIQRLLTRRIERLREGMGLIGSGYLDHRIPVAGNDELSDLARAGNAMAAQLMETTTSVENLQREVTERKRAEEKQREALEELDTTLHSIGDAVISTDLEGRVRQMNPVAEQLTGWTEVEAQGRPLEEVFHIVCGETRTPVENPVQRVLREGLIVGLANHTLLIDRAGVEHPIADSGAPIRSEDNTTVGVVLVFRDRTREQAAEKELYGLMERQQAILAAVPDIIMEVDRDKVYTWANQAGREFFGNDVIGHEAADYFEGEEDVYGVVQPLFDGSSPAVYVESRQRRKDGQIRLLAWWCRSLTDDRGNVTGALSSAQDITERKRAEESLRESEAQYRKLIETMQDGVYRSSHEGKFLDINPAMVKILGYDNKEELMAIDIKSQLYFAPQDRESAALEEKLSEMGVFRLRRKDGSEIWVEDHGRHVLNDEGTVLYHEGVLRDITDRKRAEENLRLQTAVTAAINHILQGSLQAETDAEVARICLSEAEELTGSKFGWIGEVNPSGRLDTIALSDPGWEFCRISEAQAATIRDMEIRGIFGQVLKNGTSLITNEPGAHPDRVGLPSGHPELTAFLGVPLKQDGRTVGMVALGNKPSGYTANDQGAVEALSVAFVEALRRKRAEEALYLSKQRLELAQRSAGAGIWDWDMTCQHLDWSRELYILHGLDPDQVEATFDILYQVIHPDDREITSDRIDQAISDRTSYINEYRAILPDGQVRWIRALGNTIYDPSGQPLRMTGISIDITERKRAEEALRESEERFRTLVENAPEPVLIQTEGRFAYLNRAALKEFGAESADQLIGTPVLDRLHPESHAIVRERIQQLNQGSEKVPLLEEVYLRMDDTPFPVEVSAVPFSYQGRPGALVFLHSVEERKRLEEEAAKTRTDFLYAVSHELKTPLFLMAATVEMMKSQTEEERQRQFLAQEETWIRNLARLRLLINNLVDSQRTADLGTQLNRTPTDLAALVRQATQDLDVFAVKQSITWQLDLDALPDLPLDPEAIERTLHNLLTNAIKFSPLGGTVHVRLRSVPDQAVLEIEDHGKGIPEAEMPRLFQPFARTGGAIKAVIPGTGLGLYVAKILVEAHGGSISLASKEGVGSTITVTLPLREETQPRK